MSARTINLTTGAVAAVGCLLGAAGLLSDADDLLVVGGTAVTGVSLLAAFRLWRWARKVRSKERTMRPSEVRPGFLVALLVLAVLMAVGFLDAGRPEIAAWTVPIAMVLVAQTMVRAGWVRDHLK